jgi:hypothetical protein
MVSLTNSRGGRDTQLDRFAIEACADLVELYTWISYPSLFTILTILVRVFRVCPPIFEHTKGNIGPFILPVVFA